MGCVGKRRDGECSTGGGCSTGSQHRAKRGAVSTQSCVLNDAVWFARSGLQMRVGVRQRSDLRKGQRKRKNHCGSEQSPGSKHTPP